MGKASLAFCFVLALLLTKNAYSKDFSDVFMNNQAAVVTIKAGDSLGTGFYIAENFIVTNFHVISGLADIRFCNLCKDGDTPVPFIVEADKDNDLAILYVDKAEKPVQLTPSATVIPGMEVAAIGSPQGVEKTIASGTVSEIRKNGLLPISIPVSPGSSGSPVFIASGKVIGVVVAQRRNAQNLNLAIPSERVESLLKKASERPKEKYFKVGKTSLREIVGGDATPVGAVEVDYLGVDEALPGCARFSSVFFESPKIGPVKKCICNDSVVLTNLLCQCRSCKR